LYLLERYLIQQKAGIRNPPTEVVG
jgi:hypothetical protein